MSCGCNNDRLELIVKQGTLQSYNFTVHNKDGTPLNLSGYFVRVEIKKYPLAKVQPLVAWDINTYSSEGGQITSIEEGKFTIRVTSDVSTNLNPDVYYIVITLVSPDNQIIISGEGDKSGIIKICRQ